jgi:membrane protein DedA with SNARE-associated domain
MTPAAWLDMALDAAKARPDYAALAVFVLAFGESLAFMSLIFPATVALVGFGALIGAGHLPFWPVWAAAFVGAGLGDWLSFWLGRHYREEIWRLWPLSRDPSLRERSAAFLARWGALGVFMSKFWGPLRASVPLAAGLGGLPGAPFQIANWASAAVWAFGLLAPGAFGLEALRRWTG